MITKLSVILVMIAVAGCDVSENCGDADCVEGNLIKAVDRLDEQEEIPLLGDSVVIHKKNGEGSARRSGDIVDRVLQYLSSHEVKLSFPEEQIRSIEARKRKLRKLILPILLFLKLKAAIIVPAVLSFIALVAFKGLGASLVALLIAGATAFKGILADNRAPRVSYEVVPQLSAHLWNRAGIDDLSLGSGYHTIP